MPQSPLEVTARRVARDAAVARRRWLARRAGGPLLEKYLSVVPSVYSACGELAAFRLLVPRGEALSRLRDRAILTLDSATALLAGFRFGRARQEFIYLPSGDDLEAIQHSRIGERLAGGKFPLSWSPDAVDRLLAVVPQEIPPFFEHQGFRAVTCERLVRDLLGLYGLRADLVSEIETKLLKRWPGLFAGGSAAAARTRKLPG